MVDGFKYTYVDEGNATAPVLFFLHNGGGDHRCWYYQLKNLSSSFRCVALDLPGFGASDRPEAIYSVEWIAAHVEKFARAHFDRPVVFVGHCIGAATALEVHSNGPEIVSALLLVNLCGGPPGMSQGTQTFYRMMPRSPHILRAIYPAIRRWIGSEALLRQSLKQLFQDPTRTDHQGVYFEKHISRQEAQHISRRNLLLGMPSFSKYAKPFLSRPVNVPVELVWGIANPVMKPELGKWLAEYLLAPIHWMKNSQHMPMSEEHERFNEIIKGLMRKVHP